MKYLLSIIIFVSASISCTDLSSYDKDRVAEALSDSLLSVTESWDIEMEIIENGQRVVHIRAPYAKSYQEGTVTETKMDGPVEVIVSDSLGNPVTLVRSDEATYTGRESKFKFRGKVVVITEEGRILRTEMMDWMQQGRTISSDDFVTITTAADSIAGFGLTGQDDLSAYTISRVTGEFQLN
ncbi:MAG: LPS export ABC transporter periplasmic protein LptC [Balneolales bacterium]